MFTCFKKINIYNYYFRFENGIVAIFYSFLFYYTLDCFFNNQLSYYIQNRMTKYNIFLIKILISFTIYQIGFHKTII
ncbi:hypothetical protein CL656_04780 [bacterium]|nr:hypothetical protein [bacterium]